MKKIGRNDPCSCGSGIKSKKCYCNAVHVELINQAMKMAPHMFLNFEEKERKRVEQQGLGKGIISAKSGKGLHTVIVNNKIYFSSNWDTFHEFLRFYMAEILGREWGGSELDKPFNEQHPIFVWFRTLNEQQRLMGRAPGQNLDIPLTGAVVAYLQLAYDLYSLGHNAELQTKLIKRLHHKDQFIGARYEVQVAAMLARAGFTLEFEDEDDRKSRHCEFTATHSVSGKKFSVEAKKSVGSRNSSTHHISQALGKAANHTRVVFVDLNMPHLSFKDEVPDFFKNALGKLEFFESRQPHAKSLDPAYVFLTNASWEHHLDSTDWKYIVLRHGFKIDEFKINHKFLSPQSEIDARNKHKEMHDLLASIREHTNVPRSFDGESPPPELGNAAVRPIIG